MRSQEQFSSEQTCHASGIFALFVPRPTLFVPLPITVSLFAILADPSFLKLLFFPMSQVIEDIVRIVTGFGDELGDVINSDIDRVADEIDERILFNTRLRK